MDHDDRIVTVGEAAKTCSVCGVTNEYTTVYDFTSLGEQPVCSLCGMELLFNWLKTTLTDLDKIRTQLAAKDRMLAAAKLTATIKTAGKLGDSYAVMQQALLHQSNEYKKVIAVLKRKLTLSRRKHEK